MNNWLGLEIGNSRLHWGLFKGETLDFTWDTDYLPESVICQLAQSQTLNDLLLAISPLHQRTGEELSLTPSPSSSSSPPLFIASVVPSQTALWQLYPDIRIITLDQIPLKSVYPTLGIDRALALWGAG